jgi:hypothetical protein
MKACTACGALKSCDDYYKTAKGGVAARCKECAKEAVRKNYREHLDQYKEYDRGRAMAPHRVEARTRYEKTTAGKQALRSAHVKFITNNPLKHAAHTLVNNAIRDGHMKRHPCEICGNDKVHAHHDDYSKPLDVRWLCTTHHAEWHKHNTPKCPDQGQGQAA